MTGDSITITITLSRPPGCEHNNCHVEMTTDTFSSVGHGFPERMPIREALDRIAADMADAVADEFTVSYLWDEVNK